MPTPHDRLLTLEEFLRGKLFGLENEAVRGMFTLFAQASREMNGSILAAFAGAGIDGKWRLTDPGAALRNEKLFSELDSQAARLLGVTQGQFNRQMGRAYRAGYYGRAWIMGQLGNEVPAGPIPQETVQAAIAAPYEESTFFARMDGARLDFIRDMRKSIVASQIVGDTPYSAQKRLAQNLGWDIRRTTRALKAANKGLFARSERIARTEMIRTSNMGAEAVMRQHGHLLRGFEWKASMDERTCKICFPLDGKVFAFDSPQQRPPIHPMCLPGDTYVTSTSRITGGMKRWYQGDMLFLCTARGNKLAITPNHPILTDRGWLAAKLLQPGDSVFSCLDTEWVVIRNPNHQQAPALIEQIFDSLTNMPHMLLTTVPPSPEDFDGDGGDSDVDIVFADGELSGDRDAQLSQHVGELDFEPTHFPFVPYADTAALKGFLRDPSASASVMGCLGLMPSLCLRHARPFQGLSLGSISGMDISIDKPTPDCGAAEIEALADCIFRESPIVELDKIVSIDVSTFHGFVYNLQTGDNLYLASIIQRQGIIVHNCRCTPLPVLKDPHLAPRKTYADWARERGMAPGEDGNVIQGVRGAKPPMKKQGT